MILHIFPYEKFTQDYIKKINQMFQNDDHVFLIYGDKADNEIKDINAENIIYEPKNHFVRYIKLYKLIKKSSKVIFHSLFFGTDNFLFYTILGFKNRCKYFWNIWGGDLYNEYWHRNDNIKTKIRNVIKIIFIGNLKAVGYIKSDYDFLMKHYRSDAKFYLDSYAYELFIPKNVKNGNSKSVKILLGNSATEECRYLESIDFLSFCKNENVIVYCILSYPKNKVSSEYRGKVIKYGKNIFGEKFVPIIDYMSYEKYSKLLNNIDIAIFNHNRQQALGNIASLLYLGKRVYISKENGCKEYFENIGAKVFSLECLTRSDISKKDTTNIAKINRKALDAFFSDTNFKNMWGKIFYENF